MNDQEKTIAECREMLVSGAGVEEVIGLLRKRGFPKVHSIKALVNLGQASMSEAKQIVHNSPTWSDLRKRDENFHRVVEDGATTK